MAPSPLLDADIAKIIRSFPRGIIPKIYRIDKDRPWKILQRGQVIESFREQRDRDKKFNQLLRNKETHLSRAYYSV